MDGPPIDDWAKPMGEAIDLSKATEMETTQPMQPSLQDIVKDTQTRLSPCKLKLSAGLGKAKGMHRKWKRFVR